MRLIMKRGLGAMRKKRQVPDQILGEGMNVPLRNMDYHRSLFILPWVSEKIIRRTVGMRVGVV